MGGKTMTYKKLTAQHIFNEDDDLFSLDMIRSYATTKSMAPMKIFPPMLHNINQYFNYYYLDAMQVTGQTDTEISVYSAESFIAYFNNTIGNYPTVVPYYTSMEDINGNSTVGNNTRIVSYANSHFSYITDIVHTHSDAYVFKADDGILCHNVRSAKDIHMALHGTENVTASSIIESYLYTIPGAPEENKYAFPDGDIDLWMMPFTEMWQVTLDEYEKNGDNWEPTGGTRDVQVEFIDTRTVYIIKYAYRTDMDCHSDSGWMEMTLTINRDNLVAEAYTGKVLLLPIKDNFDFVEYERYQKVLMNSLGFKEDEFKDSLSQPEVKASFITYSSGYYSQKNEALKSSLQLMYGNPHNANSIKIQNKYYHIEYMTEKYCGDMLTNPQTNEESNDFCSEEMLTYKFKVVVEDSSFDVDEDVYSDNPDEKHAGTLLIPLQDITKLPIHQKYDIIRDSMTIWGNMEKTIKLKWYQTGFFRFITMIIGVVFTVFTFGITAAMISGFSMVVSPLLKKLGPIAQAVFGLLMMGFGAGGWSFSNLFNSIRNNFLKILYNFGKTFFQARMQFKMQVIAGEISGYAQDTKEAYKEMQEYQKPRIYIPMDDYNQFYDSMYNIAYEPYQSISFSPLDQLNTKMQNNYF